MTEHAPQIIGLLGVVALIVSMGFALWDRPVDLRDHDCEPYLETQTVHEAGYKATCPSCGRRSELVYIWEMDRFGAEWMLKKWRLVDE